MIPSLPQRGRWALLEDVLAIDPEHAHTTASFTLEDVDGHFPHDPIVPGALLLEALAQTQLVLSQALELDGRARLAGFDRVRFLAPVVPPCTVDIDVRLRGRHGNLLQTEGTMKLNGQTVVTARISGTVVP